MLPMIDVVEVGAGGGSIAWIDDIGALKVGPQSAGADPGPICYRGGGTEPTITDANVVLGRLDPDNFLGGTMKLDADGAPSAASRTRSRGPLKLDVMAAAQAIVEIAIAKMSLAVREVSVAKGYDPRDFALVAFGGAGPLHVCAIARELYIPTVIVPLFPVALLGARHAAGRRAPRLHPHGLFRSRQRRFRQARRRCTTRWSTDAKAQPAPRQERAATRSISICATSARSSRCRCRSRSSSCKTGDRKAIRTAFDALYEQRYAHHSPDEPVEMVNIRLGAIGKRPKLSFPSLGDRAAAPRRPASATAYFTDRRASRCTATVYRREALGAGAEIAGPGADPGARHHHGAVPRTTACTVAPTPARLIIDQSEALTTIEARHRHARSHPQRAARRRQRDGGRPAAHLLQHDDLRGARLSAPRCSTPRAS